MAYKSRYFEPFSGTTEVIAPNAITSDKIADETIESRDIKNLQVKTEDIADKAVTLAKLGDDVPAIGIPDNSISAAKLADNSVEKRHIKTAAVDTDELANASVTTEKIRDANVTNAKIATNTITQGKIANNAIGTGEIQNGAVTPEKLSFVPGGAVRPLVPPLTSAEIGELQVTSSKLQDGSVTQEKLAPDVAAGDRFVWGSLVSQGNPGNSIEILYLVDLYLNDFIPYTTENVNQWVPAGAKGLIVQLGVRTGGWYSGFPPTLRIRSNAGQREAVCVQPVPAIANSAYCMGIIPLSGSGDRQFEYYSADNVAQMTVTFWVMLVGYIM
jgi:hypothetical protein